MGVTALADEGNARMWLPVPQEQSPLSPRVATALGSDKKTTSRLRGRSSKLSASGLSLSVCRLAIGHRFGLGNASGYQDVRLFQPGKSPAPNRNNVAGLLPWLTILLITLPESCLGIAIMIKAGGLAIRIYCRAVSAIAPLTIGPSALCRCANVEDSWSLR